MTDPIIAPRRTTEVHHHYYSSRFGATLSAVLFTTSSFLFLWGADILHVRFDKFAASAVDRILDPTILLLFSVHVALAIIMMIKGPVNGLESALIRFMLSKAMFWGWLYFLESPRPPAQYLALVIIVGITTLDVFFRMVRSYVWPFVEIFIPVKVTKAYDWIRWKALAPFRWMQSKIRRRVDRRGKRS